MSELGYPLFALLARYKSSLVLNLTQPSGHKNIASIEIFASVGNEMILSNQSGHLFSGDSDVFALVAAQCFALNLIDYECPHCVVTHRPNMLFLERLLGTNLEPPVSQYVCR